MSQQKIKDAGFHKGCDYAMSFSVRDEKLVELKLLNDSSVSDDEKYLSSSEHDKKSEEENDVHCDADKGGADDLSEKSVDASRSSCENIIVYGEKLRGAELKNGLRYRSKVQTLRLKKAKDDGDESDASVSEKEEVESGIEASKHFEMEKLEEEEEDTLEPEGEITPGNLTPLDEEPPRKRWGMSRVSNFIIVNYVYIIIAVSIIFTPSFVGGFLICILIQVMWQRFANSSVGQSLQKTPFRVPDFRQSGPLTVPLSSSKDGVWFNEYTHPYDPGSYSVSKTVPVYVEIDNSLLVLSRPRGKVNKRALCEEAKYKLEFVHRRIYDLRLCRVSLGPEGVFRRRFFNKKYPIVIDLVPDSLVKAVRLKESTGEEEDMDLEETYDAEEQDGDGYGRTYLNLFARCDRQKEEWYRRLRMAVKVHPDKSGIESGSSTPFEDITFDPEFAEYDEYWRFMSQYVVGGRESGAESGESEATVKFAVEVRWLNALLSRVMYDVFRSPYWLRQIEEKIQRKLCAVRLPEGIELDISEFDIGKVAPQIHRISEPCLDDRGLWIYMDVTFDGSFKMILQMHINRDKKGKGSEDESSDRKERSGEEEAPFFDANDFEDLNTSESEEEEDDDAEDDAGQYEDDAESGGKSESHSDGRRAVSNAGKYRWMMGSVDWNWRSLAKNKPVRSLQKTIVKNFKLVVEVKSFVGTLAINLPPPPCDRIWVGFESVPKVWMSAYPKVRELDIPFPSVKNYIEKRIMRIVKKLIVLPNMEDILLPIPPDECLLSRISGHGNSPGTKKS